MGVSLTHKSSTVSSVTVEAYHTYTNGSRAYWYHKLSSSTTWTSHGYTLLSSGTYQQKTISSLSEGKSYDFKVEIVDGSDTNLPVLGTATVSASTTNVAPTVNITSPADYTYHGGNVTIDADASDTGSGVNYVNFNNSALGTIQDTTSPYSASYNIGSLTDGQHTFSARSYDKAGNASTIDYVNIYVDNTPPSCTIDSTSKTDTTITLTASASDSGSGVSGFYFYLDGVYKATVYSSTSASYEYTGLTASTSYTVGVRAFDKVLNASATQSTTVTTSSTRPTNWKWTTSQDVNGYKIAGADYRMDDLEWNNFTTRINEFRKYKGYVTVSFTSAVDTNALTAGIFNEAKNAIGGMVSTGITDRISGDSLTASLFNTLMDKLNSL